MALKDHVVVITGATSGLGRVVSRRFAEAGSRLALIGTNRAKLTELEGGLNLPKERMISCIADLTLSYAAEKVSDTVIGKFGRVDILLHFVGGWISGKPLNQVTGEEISTMLE